MAGHKASRKPDKCSGKRKDGSPCNTHAFKDGLCAWHLGLRDAGDATPTKAAHRGLVELLPMEAEPDDVEVRGDEAAGGIRQHFQDAATKNRQKIVVSLLECLDAYSAGRKVRCPNEKCGLEFSVQVPDGGARVKASEALVSLGYGTPPKDDSAKTETVDLGVDVYSLDSEELRAHIEGIYRGYPQDVARFTAKTAAAKAAASKTTKPRTGAAVVPPKQRPRP